MKSAPRLSPGFPTLSRTRDRVGPAMSTGGRPLRMPGYQISLEEVLMLPLNGANKIRFIITDNQCLDRKQ